MFVFEIQFHLYSFSRAKYLLLPDCIFEPPKIIGFSETKDNCNILQITGHMEKKHPRILIESPNPNVVFNTGNSEIMSGVLHLLRERDEQDFSDFSLTKPSIVYSVSGDEFHYRLRYPVGSVLCVLAVPCFMSFSEFIKFAGNHLDEASHVRFLRLLFLIKENLLLIVTWSSSNSKITNHPNHSTTSTTENNSTKASPKIATLSVSNQLTLKPQRNHCLKTSFLTFPKIHKVR